MQSPGSEAGNPKQKYSIISAFAVISRKLTGAFGSRLVLTGLPLTGLLLAAIWAHVNVRGAAAEYTGPIAVLDHIFDVTVALFLSLVMVLVGFTIADKLRLTFGNTAERMSFYLFIGAG